MRRRSYSAHDMTRLEAFTPTAWTVGNLTRSKRRSSAHSWTRCLRVKPPHCVACCEAERFDQLYCLVATQRHPAPLTCEAGAISRYDFIERGEAAFIRAHEMDMVPHGAAGNRDVTGR